MPAPWKFALLETTASRKRYRVYRYVTEASLVIVEYCPSTGGVYCQSCTAPQSCTHAKSLKRHVASGDAL
jgi:hypothetical protein